MCRRVTAAGQEVCIESRRALQSCSRGRRIMHYLGYPAPPLTTSLAAAVAPAKVLTIAALPQAELGVSGLLARQSVTSLLAHRGVEVGQER